jgi:hypothetical protein
MLLHPFSVSEFVVIPSNIQGLGACWRFIPDAGRGQASAGTGWRPGGRRAARDGITRGVVSAEVSRGWYHPGTIFGA